MPWTRGTARGCQSGSRTRYRSRGPIFGPVGGCGLATTDSRGGRRRRENVLTLRNSSVASCHSLVMVAGAGLANMRIDAKMTKLATRPMTV